MEDEAAGLWTSSPVRSRFLCPAWRCELGLLSIAQLPWRSCSAYLPTCYRWGGRAEHKRREKRGKDNSKNIKSEILPNHFKPNPYFSFPLWSLDSLNHVSQEHLLSHLHHTIITKHINKDYSHNDDLREQNRNVQKLHSYLYMHIKKNLVTFFLFCLNLWRSQNTPCCDLYPLSQGFGWNPDDLGSSVHIHTKLTSIYSAKRISVLHFIAGTWCWCSDGSDKMSQR